MTSRTGTPKDCPACGTELYPVARFRPRAGLAPLARMLLAIGAAASGLIWVGAAIYIRWVRGLRGGALFGVITLPPAIVPGLIFGWAAYRLPRRLTLRCRHCPWRERFSVARDGIARPTAAFPATWARARPAPSRHDPAFDRIEVASPCPPPPPAVTGGGFEIVDDAASAGQVDRWIHAAMAEGRAPEDLVADLTASGWDVDGADGLVERVRKRTRHLRP